VLVGAVDIYANHALILIGSAATTNWQSTSQRAGGAAQRNSALRALPKVMGQRRGQVVLGQER
jgi:hypothetical protein